MNLKFAFSMMALAAAAFSSANLVQNGDFSLGETDWTVVAPIEPGTTFTYTYVSGSNVLAGPSNSAFFGSTQAYGSFSQSVATTVGDFYKLTYDVADLNSFYGGSYVGENFKVTANSLTLQNDGYFNGILHEDFTFQATSTSTLLTFAGINPGQSYELGKVDLVQSVPEPCSMVALGMGALALIRRRKA